MEHPNIKTLSKIFGGNAKKAKLFLTCNCETLLEESHAANDCQRQSYGKQANTHLRMVALNDLGEFSGVESIKTTDHEYAHYLNAGDTYNSTLILWRGRWFVTCLGDFVETMETRGIEFI